MKQGRMLLPFVLAAALVAPLALVATHAEAAAKKSSSATPKKSYALRQFTGVVTSLDKSSLTVQKTGKTASTMVFARHAQLRITGELEKDARVTVYWRDEAGHPVAHKVVVKTAPLTAAK